jgi:uncharacterized protein (TIGR00299 family) protein
MILHFDFSTGASGDKIIASLIEICEALDIACFEDVRKLGESLVPGVRVERTSIQSGGVQATGIDVIEEGAHVRHWHEIRSQIEQAGADGILSARATSLSLEAFQAVAEAEAAVHGTSIEHVHFHEVGAADSIIDICCSSFLIDKLAPELVFATPLALGFCTFICSHGELPGPAPATALLIEGLPVYAGSYEGELTTPTGATLARIFVNSWGSLPTVVPKAVGYGGGTRTIPGAANVVRVIAGELIDPQDEVGEISRTFTLEGCTLLETNIDHLSPEALAFACEELLARGALDVWQDPITMKKGRLAVRLNVLVVVVATQSFADSIIELTGSLGVRRSYVERTIVPREIVQQETAYGSVAYKTALIATPSGSIKLQRPEYEDVARIAREYGLDFNVLYAELRQSEVGESQR